MSVSDEVPPSRRIFIVSEGRVPLREADAEEKRAVYRVHKNPGWEHYRKDSGRVFLTRREALEAQLAALARHEARVRRELEDAQERARAELRATATALSEVRAELAKAQG
jgi:hypothetical protein